MSKLLQALVLSFGVTTAQAEVLWDNWYTVSKSNKPEAYYHEKAEIVGDRAKIQVNSWNRKGNQTYAENLGATAKNTALLEPLLYNFHRQNAAGGDTVLDGSVINSGKVFSVKITEGPLTRKPLRAEMLPKLILASFFPVWINKNYKRITGVQPIEFMAIIEDQVKDEVPVVKGDVYEMRQDDFAKKYDARKLRIVFAETVNFWWVTKKGDAIRIEIPSQEKVVEKVDQKTAESFLSKL